MSTSTASPQKRGGTPDVTTLTNDYTDSADSLADAPLPTYRADELVARVRAVRDSLDAEGAVPGPTLQRLLAVVAEAVGDVTAAEIDRDAGDGRTLTGVVPGAGGDAAYRLTPAERDALLEALIELLFTVVETPTVGRAADDDAGATDGDDADATDPDAADATRP